MVTPCHKQAASENREQGDAEVAALLNQIGGGQLGFQKTHAKALETASHREQTGIAVTGPGDAFPRQRLSESSGTSDHKMFPNAESQA